MTLRRKLSFGLYLINALILYVFAARYLLADRLMPYHAETIGVARDGLPAEQMLVFITLYRAVGAGMLGVGIAILFVLLLPFRAGAGWSTWCMTAVGLAYGGVSLFLTLAYQAGTTAAVPWPGPAVAVVTIVIAHLLAGKAEARPT